MHVPCCRRLRNAGVRGGNVQTEANPQFVNITCRPPFGFDAANGKLRSYRLGELIQNRYQSLISSHYNQSEVFIRSTNSARAKMSVLTALAAIYPPLKPSLEQ
ncbi:hypothetical protein ACJJTC_007743 [Scirpophaga incertulas]